MSVVLLLVGILSSITVAESVGVCYGTLGTNLPSRQEVVELYKRNGIGKMRLYHEDEEALGALKGSGIELIMDVAKEKIQSLANPVAARNWVNRYVKPYSRDVKFKYIVVGNEILPNAPEANSILPAMTNIQNAISEANLQGQIKVSTAIYLGFIADPSYPPNIAKFKLEVERYIKPIINFLVINGAPLLANVYPYFAYYDDHRIKLEYALFTQGQTDGAGYQNLFDAMLDSIYYAVEKVGEPNLKIVVSESGWPSFGEYGASVENAATYYTNLIRHVSSGNGTPKRPGETIETYLFAMFNENQKPGKETERHFGLFKPDKSPKYQLRFN